MANQEHERRDEGINWKRWAALGALALLLIFVLQNSREEEVNFLFATTTTPLFFALAVAALLGALLGWLAPRVRRRRD